MIPTAPDLLAANDQDQPGDMFGDMMNAPAKYVVSKTLDRPIWRNTTVIRDNVIDAVRKLKAAPGKNILTDGSQQLVHTLLQHDLVDQLHLLLYPLLLGGGKHLFPAGVHTTFKLKEATPYPTGVVRLHYGRGSYCKVSGPSASESLRGRRVGTS